MTDPLNPDLTPIQQFYTKCNIFITGGTGFLGKVLLNKILTSCPGIENIYLLVRNKRGKDVHSRVEEIFEDPVSVKNFFGVFAMKNLRITYHSRYSNQWKRFVPNTDTWFKVLQGTAYSQVWVSVIKTEKHW